MQTRYRRPCSALLPALLLAAGWATAAPPAGDEEYRVLRTYLDSPYAEKAAWEVYDRIGIYFIYNVDPKRPESIAGFFRTYARTELDPALVGSFVAANHHPQAIDRRRFPGPVRYSGQFLKAGVYSLSRVGFNARRDEALMYASYSSLTEEGHGALVHLRKAGGTWAVTRSSAVWMYGASVHPFNP
jgi:hypothetical protein